MADWQGVGAVRESAVVFRHYMIDNHKKTSYMGSQKGVILKRIVSLEYLMIIFKFYLGCQESILRILRKLIPVKYFKDMHIKVCI